MLKKILSKATDFIYAGENEKPIRPLNFRNSASGRLGLINPNVKAKALLIKNMNRDESSESEFPSVTPNFSQLLRTGFQN